MFDVNTQGGFQCVLINADELGLFKIIQVHEHSIGLKGVLVIDNLACGPSLGGVRMAVDVTREECAWLARTMTFLVIKFRVGAKFQSGAIGRK